MGIEHPEYLKFLPVVGCVIAAAAYYFGLYCGKQLGRNEVVSERGRLNETPSELARRVNTR